MKRMEGTTVWQDFRLNYFGISDRGQVRTLNEDDFLIMPEYHLFCVADGMGGHAAGDVASRLSLEGIGDYFAFRHHPEEIPRPALLPDDLVNTPLLEGAVHYANLRVNQAAGNKTMGSTLVAAFAVEQAIQVIHVGDSRAYLWRDRKLQQITEDHSLVYELYRQGQISKEDMRTHPQRNVITQALGPQTRIAPTILRFSPLRDDLLLLCSDGLTTMLEDSELSSIVSTHPTVHDIGSTLVEQANMAGGKDNITVVLIHIE